MQKTAFVGTWKLLSIEGHVSDGQILHPYGSDPRGRLIYDALGNMAVQILRSERQTFAGNDKSQGSTGEITSAFTSYESYFGTYTIDEDQGVVIHHLEGALFPNWTGSEQRRYFQFSEPYLTLSAAGIPYGGATLMATVVWERIR